MSIDPKRRSRFQGRIRVGRVILAAVIAILLLFFLIWGIITLLSNSRDYICLDAGHGGNDTGAVNGERLEKEDNLALALAVQDELEKQGQKVYLTRQNDQEVSLKKRVSSANRKNCLVFVSLHRNSGSGNGTEIWVEHSAPTEDVQLAGEILSQLDEAGLSSNRGIKTGYRDSGSEEDYYINRATKMPSCLVEMGFINSEEDNHLLDQNLKEYARAIAKGILNYLDIPWKN
jgi:N-acetylmuramoyl-L-alanine amidase